MPGILRSVDKQRPDYATLANAGTTPETGQVDRVKELVERLLR